MFSAFSKLSFGVAALAAVAGVVYGLAAGADQGGSAIFFAVSVGAAVMGVAAYATADADRAPFVAADAPAPERIAPRADAAPGSTWPFGAGLAVTLLAVGVATGAPIVGIGVIAVTVVAFGWLAQVWREHPNWRTDYSERLNDRFILPIGLPGTILLFGGIGVFSFSRLLLAVSEAAAPLIAFVVACIALAACAYVAQKNPGKSALTGLATIGAVLVIASGVGGAIAGEREFHHEGGEEHAAEDGGAGKDAGGHGENSDAGDDHGDAEDGGGTAQDEADAGDDGKNAQTEDQDETGAENSAGNETLSISAENEQEFDTVRLEAPARTKVNLVFDNRQKGVPHNVSVYDDAGDPIHEGEIITGPRRETETFTTPEAGTYKFQCDVHPAMNGELVVT